MVVGGGFGGVTCAKYLRRADATLDVTLVEPHRQFVTCPFSNAVLVGLRDLASVTHGYEALRQRHGVRVVHATATALDPTARRVTLDNGSTLAYDRLVLAPGIELQWGAIEGYDAAASEAFPHAWLAGPQTLLLRRQLEAMEDGGLVVISAPDNPYRCPPGPYERASLIAHYLKTHKPRSKLLLLDAKDTFTKQELFRTAWQRLYPGLLEWVPGSQSGRVIRVNTGTGTVHTAFDEYKPAVANIIPPQRAAAIARTAGLDDGKGWCRVQARTFESTVHAGIHLIGDAIIASPMPKSAFSANTQAKVCAAAIVFAAWCPGPRTSADEHVLQPRRPRLRHLNRWRLSRHRGKNHRRGRVRGCQSARRTGRDTVPRSGIRTVMVQQHHGRRVLEPARADVWRHAWWVYAPS